MLGGEQPACLGEECDAGKALVSSACSSVGIRSQLLVRRIDPAVRESGLLRSPTGIFFAKRHLH